MGASVVLDDWVTLDDLGDYMNVDEMWRSSAELAIGSAQQIVRKYLDQDVTFVAEDVEVHDGGARRLLRLRQRPVRGVISLTIDGAEFFENVDFELRGSTLRLTWWDYFPYGSGNVVVEYDHGWDAFEDSTTGYEYEPVPDDLKLVTLAIAKRKYLGMDDQDETKVSETIGQYSYTRGNNSAELKDVTFSEAAVLDRYVVRGTPKP